MWNTHKNVCALIRISHLKWALFRIYPCGIKKPCVERYCKKKLSPTYALSCPMFLGASEYLCPIFWGHLNICVPFSGAI